LFINFSFTLRREIYSIRRKGLSYLVNSVKESSYQLFTKIYTEGGKSQIIIGGYNFEKERQNLRRIFHCDIVKFMNKSDLNAKICFLAF